MPPDRLDALRRQRALVAQHLAWLDAELSAASPASPPAIAERETPPPPAPPALAPEPVAEAPASDLPAAPPEPGSDEARLADANARAAAILEQYAVTDRFNPEATKRGCMLFATAVFLLGTAGVIALYIFFYR